MREWTFSDGLQSWLFRKAGDKRFALIPVKPITGGKRPHFDRGLQVGIKWVFEFFPSATSRAVLEGGKVPIIDPTPKEFRQADAQWERLLLKEQAQMQADKEFAQHVDQ